jgi:hypothetical protein
VRVIVAHHLADDLRALAIARVADRPMSFMPYSTRRVCRLQAVSYVGQRSPDDTLMAYSMYERFISSSMLIGMRLAVGVVMNLRAA